MSLKNYGTTRKQSLLYLLRFSLMTLSALIQVLTSLKETYSKLLIENLHQGFLGNVFIKNLQGKPVPDTLLILLGMFLNPSCPGIHVVLFQLYLNQYKAPYLQTRFDRSIRVGLIAGHQQGVNGGDGLGIIYSHIKLTSQDINPLYTSIDSLGR